MRTATVATVLIGADICPIGRNAALFERGDVAGLYHDLLEDFSAADLVLANLECPLIGAPTPIPKTGPTFGASPASLAGIGAAGIDLLCLANNHIYDHGPQGLESTLLACREAGIATVGAGMNLADARRIVVMRAGDVRVAVLAMAEHEFSVATPRTAGANPLDLIDFVRNVSAARGSFDYLIVLLHGGQEFLTVPSPRLRETCRFVVEMGANAVIVQHPHAAGGCEKHRGGHIVYGQGALVMDEAIYRDRASFHEGFLVSLAITPDNTSSMRCIPFAQSDRAAGARRMDEDRSAAFLRELAVKSRAILDDEHVDREWNRFCDEQKHEYLSILLGFNRVLRLANRWGHLSRLLYNRRRRLGARNLVCCESHRDVLETIFKEDLI